MNTKTQAKILENVIDGDLSIREAADALGCSNRTVWRKIARYKEAGADGLVHGLTGRPSNRAKPDDLRERIVDLYRQNEGALAISRFTRNLVDSHGIEISRETVRKWLIDAGMWEGRKN